MKRVQTNVSSGRSPEEVYAYLVDFTNQAEWRFDVLRSELVAGATGRVGIVASPHRRPLRAGPGAGARLGGVSVLPRSARS